MDAFGFSAANTKMAMFMGYAYNSTGRTPNYWEIVDSLSFAMGFRIMQLTDAGGHFLILSRKQFLFRCLEGSGGDSRCGSLGETHPKHYIGTWLSRLRLVPEIVPLRFMRKYHIRVSDYVSTSKSHH
jgi:hypothetical protein